MRKGNCSETAVIIAALAIIASSAAWIVSSRRRGAAARQVVEEALQTWEAEGGAVPIDDEDEALA